MPVILGAASAVIAGYVVGVFLAILVETGGIFVMAGDHDFFWSMWWQQSWIRLLIPLLSAVTGLLVFLAVKDHRLRELAVALVFVIITGSALVALLAESVIPPPLSVLLHVSKQLFPNGPLSGECSKPFDAPVLVFDQNDAFLGGQIDIGRGISIVHDNDPECEFEFEVGVRRLSETDTYTIQFGDWTWESAESDTDSDGSPRVFLTVHS